MQGRREHHPLQRRRQRHRSDDRRVPVAHRAGFDRVLEQNYEYDVVSAQKLLEKYLGKDVTVSRKASPDVTRPSKT